MVGKGGLPPLNFNQLSIFKDKISSCKVSWLGWFTPGSTLISSQSSKTEFQLQSLMVGKGGLPPLNFEQLSIFRDRNSSCKVSGVGKWVTHTPRFIRVQSQEEDGCWSWVCLKIESCSKLSGGKPPFPTMRLCNWSSVLEDRGLIKVEAG
jgi:hypothetical protein